MGAPRVHSMAALALLAVVGLPAPGSTAELAVVDVSGSLRLSASTPTAGSDSAVIPFSGVLVSGSVEVGDPQAAIGVPPGFARAEGSLDGTLSSTIAGLQFAGEAEAVADGTGMSFAEAVGGATLRVLLDEPTRLRVRIEGNDSPDPQNYARIEHEELGFAWQWFGGSFPGVEVLNCSDPPIDPLPGVPECNTLFLATIQPELLPAGTYAIRILDYRVPAESPGDFGPESFGVGVSLEIFPPAVPVAGPGAYAALALVLAGSGGWAWFRRNRPQA